MPEFTLADVTRLFDLIEQSTPAGTAFAECRLDSGAEFLLSRDGKLIAQDGLYACGQLQRADGGIWLFDVVATDQGIALDADGVQILLDDPAAAQKLQPLLQEFSNTTLCCLPPNRQTPTGVAAETPAAAPVTLQWHWPQALLGLVLAWSIFSMGARLPLLMQQYWGKKQPDIVATMPANGNSAPTINTGQAPPPALPPCCQPKGSKDNNPAPNNSGNTNLPTALAEKRRRRELGA